MRSKVLVDRRTYPLASLWTTSIYLWTLSSVAHSLQDGCLSRVGSSDNEDPKLVVWDFRKTLLDVRRTLLDPGGTLPGSVTTQTCTHSIKVSQDSKLARG
jgi:hypothetical protein